MTRRIWLAIVVAVGLWLPFYFRPADTSRAPHRDSPGDGATDSDCVGLLAPPRRANVADEFPDVTDRLGVDFAHTVGPLGTYFMPEVNGCGGALFDFDNDGDLDLFFVNSARSPAARGEFPAGTHPGNRLYRQDADGTFADVTAGSGLEGGGYGVGCAVGDMDNDGDLDVYVTHVGCDQVYQNNGNGTFTNITAAAGIDEQDYGTAAAFLDYDRDGWLDLIVVNYVHDPVYGLSIACGSVAGRNGYCGPHKFSKTALRLYHNEGLTAGDGDHAPAVRFRDVSAAAGLAESPCAGLGVVCADFNGDGRADIYVANDMAPKQMWISQEGGGFRDEALIRGVAVSGQGLVQGSMGVAIGDVDGDGAVDIAVTNLFNERTILYVNDGSGMFVDGTLPARIAAPTLRHTGWGIALIDLDHDGDLDLVQVNGLVVPCHSGFPPHGEDNFRKVSETIVDPAAFWRDYSDDNLLLFNDGSGRFTDGSSRAAAFTRSGASGRALIWGDIDNDGDIDLVVTNCGGRARIYRNDLPKAGHWLLVRAVDPRFKRDACGAEVTVVAGPRRLRRLVDPASSYLASNDARAHFGLGPAGQYDQIVIRWPEGQLEQFPAGAADQSITLKRGEGRSLSEENQP
jgi:hypothetical protein